MAAHFEEVQKNSGVDHDHHPPVMMIPLPRDAGNMGSNVVQLIGGGGYTISTSHKRLKVKEVNNQYEAKIDLMLAINPFGGLTLVTGKQLLANTRLLRISCDVTLGKQGGKIFAKSGGKPNFTAAIEVVALRERRIKLAIQQVKLPNGKLLSRKPADARALCDALNRIWKPQANIFFELLSTEPAEIELPTDEGFFLKPEDHLSKFKSARHPKVDFTIFLVRNIGTPRELAMGRTLAEHAVAFVADYARGLADGERTIAHEAGHWLGAFDTKGSFIRFPDGLEMRPTHLMTQGDDGGNGLKLSLRETSMISKEKNRNKGVLERFNWNYTK